MSDRISDLTADPAADSTSLYETERAGQSYKQTASDVGDAIGFTAHKSRHATGGADAIAPSDIAAVANGGDAAGILVGPASSTDANGNPTPDTTAYDPATYQNYLFVAESFPAAVDDGDMTFRSVETSPGVWEWVWIQGSFRASNANGDYVRHADGTQECDVWDFVTGDGSSVSLTDTKTLPATFASLTSLGHGALGVKTASDPTSITDWVGSAGSANSSIEPGLSSITVTIRDTRDTAQSSGTRVGWSASLRGTW